MNKAMMVSMLFFLGSVEARNSSYVSDRFGYTHTSTCPVDYVDLSTDGKLLTLTPAGAVAADDDGAALLNLTEPFLFYRKMYPSLVISSNGYVSFANDLTEESGGDFSNDCLFPSVPDNQPGALARIMPLHDDLENSGSGGIRTAYYAVCPRMGNMTSACTVIDWFDWRIRGTLNGFDFQIILYHQNGEVVMQYGADNPASGSASIGIQDGVLNSGVIVSCNDPAQSLNNSAVCLHNPIIFADGFEQ
ncbi:hypothetical protein [Marinicella sp. W31]|uniref:hypothetical protein n=1 Tax=Marinicella sp. W31 TaxID=3023713 RepID=UPI003757ACA6